MKSEESTEIAKTLSDEELELGLVILLNEARSRGLCAGGVWVYSDIQYAYSNVLDREGELSPDQIKNIIRQFDRYEYQSDEELCNLIESELP